MSTNNARASNLSLPQYGYDLVVATTQDAINATTKQFLSGFKGKEFIACYKFVKGHAPEPMDYNAVKKAIDGTDPFTIPNGADEKNPKVQKLGDLDFMFGFRAKMGLPPGLGPTEIPDVVVLDQGSALVTYQLFFAEFDIVVLDVRRSEMTWTKLSQPDGKPWICKFNVSLKLGDADFNKLPPEVQTKVKNLNPGSAFSVQQLYLDLNTAGLQSSPEIAGLPPNSDAYFFLTKVFLNTYWKQVREAGGDVLLGYTVTPDKPNPRTPSLVPTDLAIEVSPNVNAQGVATKNYGLYTVDYLVMSDNHVLPAPVPFNWNWVTEQEEADFHGAMAIKKARFASYLNQVLSPSLNEICLVPHCSVSWDDKRAATVKYTTGAFTREPAAQTYRLVSDGTSKVLTFSYEGKAYSELGVKPVRTGEYGINCFTQSDVFLENNTIRTSTLFNGHVLLKAFEGGVDNDLVRYKVETIFHINVDSQGNLVVKLAEGWPKLDDQSQRVDPDLWSKFVTLGQINKCVDHLKDAILSPIKGFLTGHDQAILNIISGSAAWVFPGAQTFTYKQVYFSDHQDLVTHITYVDPA